jgi:hypothetical protein
MSRKVAISRLSTLATLVCSAMLAQQRQALPSGPMQAKAQEACLACHDGRIVFQQQLDRKGWAKSIDKMMRWGAPVAPEDRDAMIDYFAQNFGVVEPPAGTKLVEAPGAEKVRAACLGCHDAGPIVAQRLTRRGWAGVLDRQVRWGAKVTAEDRQAILNYLATHYPAPAARPAPPPPKN